MSCIPLHWGSTVVAVGVAFFFVVGGCQDSPEPASSSPPRAAPETVQTAAPAEEKSTPSPEDIEEPEGMVHVPSGSTQIGVKTKHWEALRRNRSPGPRPLFGRNAHPPIWVEVGAFFLDVHPVTVAQFRTFVEETGYATQAEKFGNGGVLKDGQWRLVDGATWRRPRGPDRPKAPDDHPVTQVSWNDAQAYCEWAGKRLPTEVEWEHAAREGQNRRALCPWDGSCRDRSVRIEHANTWQGRYPVQNTAADGYRYTSPVGAFKANALGLQDMSGNVWEWTHSWMRPYKKRGTGFQPSERRRRVMRGGSFICQECGGYFVFARSAATPQTALFHVGFRCAKDPPFPEGE
jgi:sulfatase modifying factor 1